MLDIVLGIVLDIVIYVYMYTYIDRCSVCVASVAMLKGNSCIITDRRHYILHILNILHILHIIHNIHGEN